MNKSKKSHPRFKESRRLGLNVYRHPKAMERAQRGTSRADRKLTEYGMQLLEKQRLKAYYGVSEKQMRRYFNESVNQDTLTGTAMVQKLETRLDNIVYKLGFAASIRQARQMVVHGHILVNGKKVDIPSFNVKVGDTISLREKSRDIEAYTENYLNKPHVLKYLERNLDDFSGKLVEIPQREDIDIEISDYLVVEFYSKNS